VKGFLYRVLYEKLFWIVKMIVGFDSCMEQSLEENRVSSFRLVMGEEKERRWKREGGKRRRK